MAERYNHHCDQTPHTGNFSTRLGQAQPHCAQPVPYPCAWDDKANQYACRAPSGRVEYFACQNSAYGLLNYDATYTTVGPNVHRAYNPTRPSCTVPYCPAPRTCQLK